MKEDRTWQIANGVEVIRWNRKGTRAKAVKRLSDGLIFSKGEYVNWGRITNFNLYNAHKEAWVYFDGEIYGKQIHDLSKPISN